MQLLKQVFVNVINEDILGDAGTRCSVIACMAFSSM